MNAVARGLLRVSPMVHVLGFHPTSIRVVNGITYGKTLPRLAMSYVVYFYRLLL